MKRKTMLMLLTSLCICMVGCGNSEMSEKTEQSETVEATQEIVEETVASDVQMTEETSDTETALAIEEEVVTPIFREEDWQFIICNKWNNDLPVFGFNFKEVPDEIEFFGINGISNEGSINYKFYEEDITLPDSLEAYDYTMYVYDYKDSLYAEANCTYNIRVQLLPPDYKSEYSTLEEKTSVNTYWGPANIYYDSEYDNEFALLSLDSAYGSQIIQISCNPTMIAEKKYRGYLEKRLSSMLTPIFEEEIASSVNQIPDSESEKETNTPE